MADEKPVSTMTLIGIPALITLGITILRLVGELQHWPKPWIDAAAGGGGAIIGISWLPIIFGPYFALKLTSGGEEPERVGRAIGLTVLGLVVCVGGAVLIGVTFSHPSVLTLLGFVVMLAGAFVPRIGWHRMGNVLIAYAFAARVPVLVVMFLALRGNGGTGWGTHYDVVAPLFVQASLARKFFYEAFLPQMTLWIAWTVIAGSLFGIGAVALSRLRKKAAHATA